MYDIIAHSMKVYTFIKVRQCIFYEPCKHAGQFKFLKKTFIGMRLEIGTNAGKTRGDLC